MAPRALRSGEGRQEHLRGWCARCDLLREGFGDGRARHRAHAAAGVVWRRARRSSGDPTARPRAWLSDPRHRSAWVVRGAHDPELRRQRSVGEPRNVGRWPRRWLPGSRGRRSPLRERPRVDLARGAERHRHRAREREDVQRPRGARIRALRARGRQEDRGCREAVGRPHPLRETRGVREDREGVDEGQGVRKRGAHALHGVESGVRRRQPRKASAGDASFVGGVRRSDARRGGA